jgi:hypothetical protein
VRRVDLFAFAVCLAKYARLVSAAELFVSGRLANELAHVYLIATLWQNGFDNIFAIAIAVVIIAVVVVVEAFAIVRMSTSEGLLDRPTAFFFASCIISNVRCCVQS